MAANILLIKAAVSIGTSSKGRKAVKVIIIAAVCILMLLLMAVITVFMGFFGIFVRNGKIETADVIHVKDTQIYKDIRNIYDGYAAGQKEMMAEFEEKYYNENLDYREISVYNEAAKRFEKKKEQYCTADIYVSSYQYIKTAYVMAYLSCVHKRDYLKNRNASIDADELTAFWDAAGGEVLVSIEGEEGNTNYYIYNTVLTAEEIAEKLFSSDIEKKEYLQSAYLISQYIGEEIFEAESGAITENFMDIPLYCQYAAEWGGRKYGSGIMAQNGSAPSCTAMVLSYLTGTEITPDDVVDFTGNRYCAYGTGSGWQIFQACAPNWGIGFENLGKSSSMIQQALSAGKPVVMSMGSGTFTAGSHFIVLTGITADGNVTVNDPNDNEEKNHAGKFFPLKQILAESKGGWCFE